MKSSIRRRYCSLFAAALLSTCTVAWAAPTVQAARAPSAAELMREAERLSNEKSLAEATVAARAAMEAGRKGSALDFTHLDAGVLLVNLLHKQGRYSEARSAAEEQIAYLEQQKASLGRTGRQDPRSKKMLGMAIEASMMAGERDEVARLQEKLFAVADPGQGLWRLSPEEPRLHYGLADFSMPLILGQWNLTRFEPAVDRGSDSWVAYKQVLGAGGLNAEITLSYDETQRKESAAGWQEWLQSHPAQALASAMPDRPFDGLTTAKSAEQSECKGEPCIRVGWAVIRGDWRMDILVMYRPQDEAQAAEQVRQLFAALKWRSAPALFRERTMAEQSREIDSYWTSPGGWSKAAELAEQALPDAYFPEEIARLNTLVGVSQYKRGALDAARSSLNLAVSAWENDSVDMEDSLYRPALDFAADIAHRQGRVQEAVALNRTLIELQQRRVTPGWGISNDENAWVNRRKGMRLPLRVGDYRLTLSGENPFDYENLQTGGRLGLTIGLAQSSDEEFESFLRTFMADKLRLQAGEVRRTKFSPKSAKQGESQASGRKWEFDVTKLPGDKGASDKDPFTGALRGTPVQMAFWIVESEGQRSLLQTIIREGGHQAKTDGDQIVQAVAW
ncbi:MAG: hypothetical protein JWP42_676 [Pseudomonas sp.]|nr:hypothetical protein [Pseudomonas sp.]